MRNLLILRLTISQLTADTHCGVIGQFVPSLVAEDYKTAVEPAQILCHNTVVPPAAGILARFKTAIPTTARVSFLNTCECLLI